MIWEIIQVLPFAFLIFSLTFFLTHTKNKQIFISLFMFLTIESLIFGFTSLEIVIHFPPNETRMFIVNIFFLICVIILAIYYFVCFRKNKQMAKKIFCLFSGSTYAVFSTSISNLLFNILFPDLPLKYYPYAIESDIIYLVISLFLIAFLYLFIKKFYFPIHEIIQQIDFRYFAALSSLLFFLVTIISNFLDIFYLKNSTNIFLLFTLFFSIFLIYIICLLLLHSFYEKIIVQKQLQQMKQTVALSQQQFNQISKHIELHRKFQHDLHHHAMILNNLLRNQKMEDAIQYINDYLFSVDRFSENQKYCSNIAINTMLNYYHGLCLEKEILFSWHIKTECNEYQDGIFPVDNTDIVIILGNLLENAFEAASDCKPPLEAFIQVRILIRKSSFILAVDNSFLKPLLKKDSEYLSTKEQYSGIGISSIKQVAEKYNGGTEFYNEDQIFHASVMLQFHNI